MKKAMKEVGIYDDTKLELKSFQLDPMAPTKTKEKYISHFTQGDKSKEPQAKMQMAYIASMAKEDGLAFNIEDAVLTNTMDAHRLIKLAEDHYSREVSERLINRLYQVYFHDGTSIADHDILTNAATEAGLALVDVERVLNSSEYRQAVINDEIEAQRSGIQAAPFFVINNKYAISGAQPYATFVKALRQVQKEEQQA